MCGLEISGRTAHDPAAIPRRPSVSAEDAPRMNYPRLLAAGCAAWTVTLTATANNWDHNAHLWLNYVGDHPLGTSRWGVHLESQFRRADSGADWQQLLLRPGINYKLNETVAFSGGYAYVDTYPYGDFPVVSKFPEHRLWEQMTVNTPLFGLTWTHRFRLEQRWLGVQRLGADGWYTDRFRYSNRMRYMLRTTVPLNDARTWYVPVWDEVFFNFGGDQRRNDFDQNRFFVGVGHQVAKGWRLEVGYMQQTIQQRNHRDWEANHTLTVWLFSNAPIPVP
jgi:hypothetical protein